MKSQPIPKKKQPIQIVNESFSSDLNSVQQERLLKDFGLHRQRIEEKRTERDKLIIQLLQLKYLMEDYLSSGDPSSIYHFGFFLKEYINRLEKKNKEFAQEVDIEPTELSQIINKHRKPSEKLIYRLEIHSNKNFPAIIWYKLLEKEKEYEIMTDREIREKEKKHVKGKLEFSF